MKHADRWLYTACRVGQTGTSGYQTYTRTNNVLPDEESELARVVAADVRSSDLESFSFGWVPLNTRRMALWQTQQGGVDDLGRDTFFSEAFVVNSSNDLEAAPYLFFGSAHFGNPLRRDEVSLSSVPPLLKDTEAPSLPISVADGNQIQDAVKVRMQRYSRRALVLVNHLLCGGSEVVPSVLIKGSQEDVLAAFALLWESTRYAPSLRAQLSLCTLLSESNDYSFTVAGRPPTWGEPSQQVRLRFSTRFGWDAAAESSHQPVNLRRTEIDQGVREFFNELFGVEMGGQMLEKAGLRKSDPVLGKYSFLSAPPSKAGQTGAVREFRSLVTAGHLEQAWAQHPDHVCSALASLTPMKIGAEDAHLPLLESIENVLKDKTPEHIKEAVDAHLFVIALNEKKPWADDCDWQWKTHVSQQSKKWVQVRDWYSTQLQLDSVGHLYLLSAEEQLGRAWERPELPSVAKLVKACAINTSLAAPVAAFLHQLSSAEKRKVLVSAFAKDRTATQHLSLALIDFACDTEFVSRSLTESPSLLLQLLYNIGPDDQSLDQALSSVARHSDARQVVKFWHDLEKHQTAYIRLSRLLADRLINDANFGREIAANPPSLIALVKQSGISDASKILRWQIPPERRVVAIDAFCRAAHDRRNSVPLDDLLALLQDAAPTSLLQAIESYSMPDILGREKELATICLKWLPQKFEGFPKIIAAIAGGISKDPSLVGPNELEKWSARLVSAFNELFPTNTPHPASIPAAGNSHFDGDFGASIDDLNNILLNAKATASLTSPSTSPTISESVKGAAESPPINASACVENEKIKSKVGETNDEVKSTKDGPNPVDFLSEPVASGAVFNDSLDTDRRYKGLVLRRGSDQPSPRPTGRSSPRRPSSTMRNPERASPRQRIEPTTSHSLTSASRSETSEMKERLKVSAIDESHYTLDKKPVEGAHRDTRQEPTTITGGKRPSISIHLIEIGLVLLAILVGIWVYHIVLGNNRSNGDAKSSYTIPSTPTMLLPSRDPPISFSISNPRIAPSGNVKHTSPLAGATFDAKEKTVATPVLIVPTPAAAAQPPPTPTPPLPTKPLDQQTIVRMLLDLKLKDPKEIKSKINNLLNQAKTEEEKAIVVDVGERYKGWSENEENISRHLQKVTKEASRGDVTTVETTVIEIESHRERLGLFLDLTPLNPESETPLATKVEIEALKTKAKEKERENAKTVNRKKEEFNSIFEQALTSERDGLLSDVQAKVEDLTKLKSDLETLGKPLSAPVEKDLDFLKIAATSYPNYRDSLSEDALDSEKAAELKRLYHQSNKESKPLKWLYLASEVHQALKLNDFCSAHDSFSKLVSWKDGKPDHSGFPEPWRPFTEKVQRVIQSALGEELSKSETLPTKVEDVEWYAPEGTLASRTKMNVVSDLQQGLATNAKTKDIQVGHLKISLIEQDGIWGKTTLNCVLAAQHALKIQVTGHIDDELFRHLGLGKKPHRPEATAKAPAAKQEKKS